MRAEFTTTAASEFQSARPAARAAHPARQRPPAARHRPGDRLRDALVALASHRGQVLAHREKAWASITFAGARHTISLLFAGSESVSAGEAFIAALPDHEFAIPGHLVADAAVIEVEHRLLPAPRLVVECELLLLEEG